jgi:methionyl-tRNA formyltransferase
MKPYRIIFLGTPDFAVPSLTALHQSEHHIPLVITQPDRPKGRGKKLHAPPVKNTAIELGINVLQPQSVNTPECVAQIESLNPDFLVVVAFGQLLKKEVLNTPKNGVLNVHPSILPKYRGPAPIQWAIIHGCSETGISIMQLDEGLDTGDVLRIEQVSIDPEETAGMLHDRLSTLGAQLLLETIQCLSEKTIVPKPQNHTLATYARLLKKKDGQIQWDQSTQSILNCIRGMNPWPGAFTFLDNKRIKIFKAKHAEISKRYTPGAILNTFPDELWIATGDGAISVLEIQSASGKRMSIADFLRGNTIVSGIQA